MRTWKRINDEYVSDRGEVIKKVEHYESYRPAGQRLATRSHMVKYYYSPQKKGKKFETLKEAKAAFDD